MRYFWFPFILLCIAVIGIAGFRGEKSTKPPLEIFADMDRQPKLRPQEGNTTFANGMSSQLPVEGTIARGEPTTIAGRAIYAYEDNAFNTGRVAGKTNYVDNLPIPVSANLLKRGQERYNIYCAPCHGKLGDGAGATSNYGILGASFHVEQIVKMPDGYLYHVITHGIPPTPEGVIRMPSYGANIDVKDRWAVVAYIRALQRSRLAVMEDVPEPQRAQFN